MKNDSWMFPTETPMDSMFDHNKDGKLTGYEIICREAWHIEQLKRFKDSEKNDK